MRILKNVNIDWLRWRWQALALSWLIILTGVGLIATRGIPLGIDFSGGTLFQLKFQTQVAEQQVLGALTGLEGEKVVQRFGDASANEMLVRLPQISGTEEAFDLEAATRQVVAGIEQAGLGSVEVVKREFVGPVIGQDLQRKGIYATIASLLGIMSYIALRFRFSFGAGAMIASLHDVLITMSLLTIFGYELSLNVVAAILTLVGYGVNDQIVIFDRVRENLRTMRREPLDMVVNKSVNQTLPRTIITAGSTTLAVLSLYLFGGDVLEGFAFALLVGIITSTYSTVFIASAVAVLLSGRKTAAPGAARSAAGKPTTKSSGRKAS